MCGENFTALQYAPHQLSKPKQIKTKLTSLTSNVRRVRRRETDRSGLEIRIRERARLSRGGEIRDCSRRWSSTQTWAPPGGRTASVTSRLRLTSGESWCLPLWARNSGPSTASSPCPWSRVTLSGWPEEGAAPREATVSPDASNRWEITTPCWTCQFQGFFWTFWKTQISSDLSLWLKQDERIHSITTTHSSQAFLYV